jgi:two-component system cell cycle sensor histidine kinase PleC
MNDILDNLKINKKKLDPVIKVVDLKGVIEEMIRIMTPHAENKRVKLTSILPHEAVNFGTDSERVQQIMVNLLSNALKFTPAKGEVKVSLTPIFENED